MSVEQVVDAYLQMAQHVLGNPTTGPVSPTPAAAVAELPHPDWTGNAAQAAVTASTALTQARSRLHTAAADVSAAIAVGTQISREANLHLQGIINDWGAEKASAATTPAPLRDSALLQSGQLHIAEVMGLISATAERFTAAAAGVRTSTADLPNNPPAAPVSADDNTARTPTPNPHRSPGPPTPSHSYPPPNPMPCPPAAPRPPRSAPPRRRPPIRAGTPRPCPRR